MNTDLLPWYKRTFRFAQTNLTENDPVSCDLDFWKSYWKEQKIQGVVVNCGGIVSYYQSSYTGQYKAKYLGERDYFKEFADAARAEGLTVIARMDINCTSEELYREHPKWYCRTSTGDAILTQGRYVTCVNGGYYQEFIPEIFREVIRKYAPDGFADNSWSGLGRKIICYCENCRSQYRSSYGRELPEAVDWNDRNYRDWIRWNYDRRGELWRQFNKVTQEAGGESCRWFGMVNADPFRTGDRFHDLRELAAQTPYLFCDHQSRDADNGFWQNMMNGALLRMAGGEELTVTESMAHYAKGARTFRLSAAPAQEVRKWMLAGIAGGIQPWCHFVGGGTQDRRKFKLTDDLMKWHSQNEALLTEGRNLADIGLVWSHENNVFFGRDEMGGRTGLPFTGMAAALAVSGISFLPVAAEDLALYSERFQTLILPEAAILTAEQQDMVIRHLEAGRNLVFSGLTGLLDREGEIADSHPLWDYLKLKHKGTEGKEACRGSENWLEHEAHNYIRITGRDCGIFKDMEETELLGFGGCIQKIESNGCLRSMGSYIPAFPIYPPEFAWIREEKEEIGAVYCGELSSGARVVYLAADIDRCYGAYRLPDHRKLLENCVSYAAGGRFPMKIKAQGEVCGSLYRQGGKLLLHLVNLCGCGGMPGTQEWNYRIGPVEVDLFVDKSLSLKGVCRRGMEMGTAELCLSGTEKEVGGQMFKLVLDTLGEYELLIIE